ncbi:uncharacterized protein METZ01_LOCUS457326, partial [marine metagenome]
RCWVMGSICRCRPPGWGPRTSPIFWNAFPALLFLSALPRLMESRSPAIPRECASTKTLFRPEWQCMRPSRCRNSPRIQS